MVTLQANSGQFISLDATPQEAHTQNFDVTEHPVEVGVNIVDHIRPKAREVKLDGIIVDAPLGGANLPGYAKGQYDLLEQLGAAGALFTVTTEQKQYSNMVITVLTQTRTSKTSDAVSLSMTLREIRTVFTQTVAPVRRAKPKAKGKDKDGAKQGAPAEQATVNKSLAKRSAPNVTLKSLGGRLF